MFDILVRGPRLILPFNEILGRDQDLRDLLNGVFHKTANETVFATEAESGRQLTFGQLKARSYVIARSLNTYHLVGVSMRPSIELIVTFVGIVRRGLTYVVLDPELPVDRQRFIEEDSAIDCVIHGSDVQPSTDSKVPWLNYHDLVSIPFLSEPTNWESDAGKNIILCIMYTSGSSGRPKGVRISISSVINRIVWQWNTFPYATNDVSCIKAQTGFGDSICEVWSPLLSGTPVVIIPKHFLIDPQKLIEAVSKFKITRIVLVPSLLIAILESINANQSVPLSLKYVICSGEELTVDIAKVFFDVFRNSNCTLANFYGSTELMADATFETFKNLEDLNRKSADGRLSIGSPIANTTLILLEQDDDGVGELVFAGKPVTSGYLNSVDCDKYIMSRNLLLDPDLGNCFRTGDLAKLITLRHYNGLQEYTFAVFQGRVDSQVKIDGNRIDLSEVAMVLKDKFGLKRPVVLFEDNRILAFVSDEEISVENVTRESLAIYLPIVAVPLIVRIRKVPILAVSGKVDRQELLAIYRGQRQDLLVQHEINWETFTDLEGEDKRKFRVLIDTMASCKITGADLTSNFFLIGGTSLNAIQTITKLKLAGFCISIDRFLEVHTLHDIVIHMTDDSDLSSWEAVGLAPDSERLISRKLREKFVVVNARSVPAKPASELFRSNFCLANEMFMGTLFGKLYDNMLKDNLSFGLVDSQNPSRLVGFASNVDESQMFAKELVLSCSPLFIAEILEAPVIARLKIKGVKKIMHGFAVLIDNKFFVSSPERIAVISFMERMNIEIAIEHGYEAIIATNTSPLTQDLATEVLGYKVEHVAENMCELMRPIVACRARANPCVGIVGKVVVKYL